MHAAPVASAASANVRRDPLSDARVNSCLSARVRAEMVGVLKQLAPRFERQVLGLGVRRVEGCTMR